ncbi:MAG: putative toxin-antitoxin system toxin component, PIN family [Chthoniobacteraceae bacterium]
MIICLDTNVLVQIFGKQQPFQPILHALMGGRLTLAVSTEILLEYEEVVTTMSGAKRWRDVARLFELLEALHGNIRKTDASFRFGVITSDPDDNKFCDCAIAANADFLVTGDHHFAPLESAGYRPKPIAPDEFVRVLLLPAK